MGSEINNCLTCPWLSLTLKRVCILLQEPTIYVNGNPVCARPANKIGEYAELGNVTRA